ncbi:MAG: hypothetical protein JW709_10510 [Sedimentisphaerales bacterium]|nr:hypothetical protein [Sedimentisphaerales bacterium]
MNRRGFLAAGCSACAGLLASSRILYAGDSDEKIRIRIIYSLHGEQQDGPDWPNHGFDFRPVMQNITNELTRLCPGFKFLPSMATGSQQAQKLLEQDKNEQIDGYLVYQMNCWNNAIETIIGSGKPVLYADFLYGGSGGFLVYTSKLLTCSSVPTNFGFIPSSRIEDVAEAVKCFKVIKKGSPAADFAAVVAGVRIARTAKPTDPACTADPLSTLPTDECIGRLKESRILAVLNDQTAPSQSILGIPIDYVPFSEINDAWQKADQDEAKIIADRWQKTAAGILDVSRETLVSSAAMYLGMKSVMHRRQANAITINCLGGFYGGHIHAYPCLGFHELCNEGLVGGCECDRSSTSAMVLATTITGGRPGYISDPVLDIAKRQIIYSHCVASNKAFGPKGPTNPFYIMTHSEDRKGAAVRSILPTGFLTTAIQINESRKEILMHQGKTVGNDPCDRACRTKLAVEPTGDFEKLFRFWNDWGWHRVTIYGDLKNPITALADALGYKIIHET